MKQYFTFLRVQSTIRRKIDEALANTISFKDKQELATIIYYPKEKLARLKVAGLLDDDMLKITLNRLIKVCKLVCSKYTRSKVRRSLPKSYAYIIEELMTEGPTRVNKGEYFDAIISSMIDLGNAEDFIIQISNLIQKMAIDRLHIIGDIFDRGKDVLQIFWLFYKLEDEAAKTGGHVSFLLGNHEALVLSNDLRYTKDKYKLLAEKLGVEYPSLFGTNTELGRWLATRNTMQIIGTDLYVHAGLGKLFYDKDLNIPTVNEEMSRALFMSKKERKALSPLTDFLYGNDGPIWYRGLVREDPKYKPLVQDSLQMMLDRYMVKHILVGHTIFKDISTFYNGKVIAVNVDNKENRKKKRGRAVLIDNGVYYVVGDDGVQRKL